MRREMGRKRGDIREEKRREIVNILLGINIAKIGKIVENLFYTTSSYSP